jgi:PadR family transcriptional regulator PadR
MREPTFYVLAALLRGPLHGYAIMKRAEELSGGRVRLATGTLYTALDRLTAEGHVQLVSEESVGGRVRRTYGLTESGSAALRAEAVRSVLSHPRSRCLRCHARDRRSWSHLPAPARHSAGCGSSVPRVEYPVGGQGWSAILVL